MSEFKCDSCQKYVSEKDKYKLRCSGECRRYLCMTCTGLDKTTTKVLYQQKYHNIRFFCSVCDSPTLKYLHDKVSQLQTSQISLENVEALGTCLKKNNDLLPVISEIYDILSNHDSKWITLYKKMDDIHSLYTKFSEDRQESLFRSIKEMKQDIFNLSSIFMDNHGESVNVQIHDSSKEELLKEVGDMRKIVNQMALTIEKLAAKDKPIIGSSPQIVKKSISAQTDHADYRDRVIINPPKVITPTPHKSSIKVDWHYVLVSKIPPSYTAIQLAHYAKEKIGTTDFIRCFPMLKNRDSSSLDFRVGVQNKGHLKQLKDISMWPPGTVLVTEKSSLTPSKISPHSPPASGTSTTGYQHFMPNTMDSRSLPPRSDSTSVNIPREVNSIKIGSDKEAIAACKSLAVEGLEAVIEKNAKKNDWIHVDPMTPPIVRLSRDSDVANGRYLLARLRDPSILKALRLYLAYLHNQPSSVCFEGHTNTSIKLILASEGLPSDVDSLRELYYRFHNAYGIGSAEVEADLSAFRSFFSSERLQHLQRAREGHGRYFSAGSPIKNKNF